ncbi:transposase domain-containing protein [Acetobacter sacchari]|nr:transposase domain-containing protein [Acetobacter sacchari]
MRDLLTRMIDGNPAARIGELLPLAQIASS